MGGLDANLMFAAGVEANLDERSQFFFVQRAVAEAGVLGAAICIAALALVVELVLGLVQRLVTPRGLKVSKTDAAVSALAPIVTEPA